MKVCTKCNTENPTKATHCMKCGALLVEEEQLSDEEKLQRKLQDEQKEKELLKAALEVALKGGAKTDSKGDQNSNRNNGTPSNVNQQVFPNSNQNNAAGIGGGVTSSTKSDPLEKKRSKWPLVVSGIVIFLLVVVLFVVIINKPVAEVEDKIVAEPNRTISSPEPFPAPEVSEADRWQENFIAILDKSNNPDNITADDTVAIKAAINAYNGLASEAQEALYNEKLQLEAALNKANKDAIMRIAKQVAIDYCRLTETSDVKKVYEIFASNVERFHGLNNIDVSVVAENVSIYDKTFDVIGNKRSSVRWETFSCQELEDGRVYIEYVEDYSFDREDNSKYSIFVLKKHIVINKNHKIISIYDEQLAKAKK